MCLFINVIINIIKLLSQYVGLLQYLKNSQIYFLTNYKNFFMVEKISYYKMQNNKTDELDMIIDKQN